MKELVLYCIMSILTNHILYILERAGCNRQNIECTNDGFLDHTCKCVCPNGNHKSCTITNSIYDRYPTFAIKTTTPVLEGE